VGTIVTTVVHVDGVVTIQVGVLWNTVGITTPEGTGVVLIRQTQRISVLAQTVQIRVSRQPGPQSEVLVLKDQGGVSGIEKYLITTQDTEGERLLLVVKADVGLVVMVITVGIGTAQDRSGNLINIFLEVGDENVKAIICMISI
jgi:hypothetical protein